MKDIENNEIEKGKWYKLVDNDTNIYDYHRFVNIIDEIDNKIYFCFELWRNSNHPELSPSIEELPEVLLKDRLLSIDKSEWEHKVKEKYKKSRKQYVDLVFNKKYRK